MRSPVRPSPCLWPPYGAGALGLLPRCFGPRRCQRRTSEWGRITNTSPELTVVYIPLLQSVISLEAVRLRVASKGCSDLLCDPGHGRSQGSGRKRTCDRVDTKARSTQSRPLSRKSKGTWAIHCFPGPAEPCLLPPSVFQQRRGDPGLASHAGPSFPGGIGVSPPLLPRRPRRHSPEVTDSGKRSNCIRLSAET